METPRSFILLSNKTGQTAGLREGSLDKSAWHTHIRSWVQIPRTWIKVDVSSQCSYSKMGSEDKGIPRVPHRPANLETTAADKRPCLRKRKLNLNTWSYPMTSICVPWHVHAHIHMHTCAPWHAHACLPQNHTHTEERLDNSWGVIQWQSTTSHAKALGLKTALEG